MTTKRPIVLDTSVLAELMKPRPDMAVLRWTNAQPIGRLAVTAVSLAELTYAMLRMSELSRTINLREALNEFTHDDLASRVLPFDALAADYFAEYVWKREQAGTPIDVAEAQTAAICKAYDVTLATRDPAPFRALGVKAVDPWTAPPPVRVVVPVVVSSPELDRNGKPIPPRRPGVARGGVGPSRLPRKRRPRAKKDAATAAGAAGAAGSGAANASAKARSGASKAPGAPGSGAGKAPGSRAATGPAAARARATKTSRSRAAKAPPEPQWRTKTATPTAQAGTSEASGGYDGTTASKHFLADRMRRHVAAKAIAARAAAARAAAAKAAADQASNADGTAGSTSAAEHPASPPREEPPARGSGPGRRGARLLGPLVDAEGRPVERSADGRVLPRAARPDAAKPTTAADQTSPGKQPTAPSTNGTTPRKPAPGD